MSTNTVRIKEAAEIIKAAMDLKAFRKYLSRKSEYSSIGTRQNWKKCFLNRYFKSVLKAAGYEDFAVSTFAGVVVIGVHSDVDEHFETKYVHDRNRHECQVTGWLEYQQVVMEPWTLYVAVRDCDQSYNRGRDNTLKSEVLQCLVEFTEEQAIYEVAPSLPHYENGYRHAKDWVEDQIPLSHFDE